MSGGSNKARRREGKGRELATCLKMPNVNGTNSCMEHPTIPVRGKQWGLD